MPDNLTATPEYVGSVTVPAGGDPRTALSIRVPIQTLTNRAAYAKQRIDQLEGRGAARTISTGVWAASEAEWSRTEFAWQTINGSTAVRVLYYLLGDLPNGVVLNTVQLWIKPQGGHVGLPATMPRISLYELPVNTPSTPGVALMTAIDDSASVSAFEAPHVIQNSTPLGLTINRANYYYILRLHTEGSTNALGACYASHAVTGVFAA